MSVPNLEGEMSCLKVYNVYRYSNKPQPLFVYRMQFFVISTVLPCILILSKSFIYQLMHI